MKNTKIIISQPRYLPVMTYLKRLYFADLFVFLDNVQRQKRGWENRNKIMINKKIKWLTIPISSSSREIICQTKIADSDWVQTHKKIIQEVYKNHPFYNKTIVEAYYSDIEKVLIKSKYDNSETVIALVLNACGIFGFKPKWIRSSELPDTNNIQGPEKLLQICKSLHATEYISGKNGIEYGISEVFKDSGIKTLFHSEDFPGYNQYKQENFIPYLSFFDPIFNLGIQKLKKWVYTKPVLSN